MRAGSFAPGLNANFEEPPPSPARAPSLDRSSLRDTSPQTLARYRGALGAPATNAHRRLTLELDMLKASRIENTRAKSAAHCQRGAFQHDAVARLKCSRTLPARRPCAPCAHASTPAARAHNTRSRAPDARAPCRSPPVPRSTPPEPSSLEAVYAPPAKSPCARRAGV